jgi:hypothetical protein
MSESETKSFYAKVHERADEILQYLWDPIGVGHFPEARDEYSSYVPQVVRLLFEEKSRQELLRYLHEIESGHMGLRQTDATLAHTEKTADTLIAHYQWLRKNEPNQSSQPTSLRSAAVLERSVKP